LVQPKLSRKESYFLADVAGHKAIRVVLRAIATGGDQDRFNSGLLVDSAANPSSGSLRSGVSADGLEYRYRIS